MVDVGGGSNKHWSVARGRVMKQMTRVGDGGGGVTEFAAWRRWMQVPEDVRPRILSSAFCPRCKLTSFAPGWTVRKVWYGILIAGSSAGCGESIARMVEDV